MIRKGRRIKPPQGSPGSGKGGVEPGSVAFQNPGEGAGDERAGAHGLSFRLSRRG